MSGVKISGLPAATVANANDQIEVNQGGMSRRVTIDQLLDVPGGAYLPLSGGTLTGPLGIGDHMHLSGLGLSTALLRITGEPTDGAAPPLVDFVDANSTGATPSTGFDLRFFGNDTNGNSQLGAVINGGMATRTAGSFKGDIDFLVYGPGSTVLAGIALSGVYSGLVPISPNVYKLGDSTLPWSNVYSTLGNFAGLLTGTTATFSGNVAMSSTATVATSLALGGTVASERLDITGNIFLRSAGTIYSSAALTVQAGTGTALTLISAATNTLIWSSTALLQFGGTGAAAPALKRSGATATLQVRQANDGADAPLQALSFSSGIASPILASRVTITGGATSAAPTLTTGPVAGNPTKWLPFDDNGVTRYIPSW